MTSRQVMIELKYTKSLADGALSTLAPSEKTLDVGHVPKVAGLDYDKSFPPTHLPGLTPRAVDHVPYESGKKFDVAPEPQESTYVVRAEIDEKRIDEVRSAKNVVGVFADVEIASTIICPSSPAMGNVGDVERLLCVPQLHSKQMDGHGVWLAIVDTGINLAHLTAHGRPITIDAARSWMKTAGWTPGNAPVNHGTMCAFDAAIAAPRATFLDIQISRPGESFTLAGHLSDAVRAYSHLFHVMQTSQQRIFGSRSMVVSNSWGMFHPSWDFPVGDPSNYSDNPNHPFNRIVATLEAAGADILFAAGNCGSHCPDGRCQGITANAIYGANGHPAVLTIGGVDVTNTLVGYSSQGPGRLSHNKPDLCGYTHFDGSGVYAADGGTSAATPIVAGVVAALRSIRPFQPINPATYPSTIRALMRSTASDLGAAGFDFDYGYGVVDGCALVRRVAFPRGVEANPCLRFNPPWWCTYDICHRYPQLCQHIIDWPRMPPPGPRPLGQDRFTGTTASSELSGSDVEQILEILQRAGHLDGLRTTRDRKASRSGGCGCGCGCGCSEKEKD